MPTLEVVRRVEAEPASVALLLAGPAMNLVFPVALYTSVYLEDTEFLPPTVGAVFLTVATLAFLAGADTLGWVLALVPAALAGLAAATGICVGCEMWLFVARRRHVELVA